MIVQQVTELRGQPDVPMGQSAERVEQHLGPTPWRGIRRDIEQHLASDSTKTTVDVRLGGQLLFENADAHAGERSLEGIELGRKLHESRVRRGSEARNLEVSKAPLVR